MELQFSKTDLGRLVRGDWELVCGRWEQADRIGKWLTIKSDGLYLNDCEKAPRPWVHPGREGLVLPLPTFTLEQFKAFCDWHPTFEWEAIESVFTNDDGTLDEGALKELASRGEAAAAMVCGVLAGADDAAPVIDLTKVVAKTTEIVVQQTIDIPRIAVVPKGEVTTGFRPFLLDVSQLRLQPGERCAATSNRNFEGRQGRGGRTHLVSPAMAAAAAIAGHFVDIREL